ncbi:DUF2071 domain-containing protein [Rapidithrix thailandica]|uniref:DUF2071 domain-containing protein n=1 Tax=Rapidithrix thailandica TaxID=413964 RepID=A0AAW9RUL6_9BACT
MLSTLKNHPFAVEAFFERSVVLTFAVPQKELQALIPECLSLDTFQDQWAFLAIAMVQTRNLRPKGFPGFLGNNFFLIGYRVFVRYVNAKGKRLRGLYILKSETDSAQMKFMGNLFTHYQYTTTDIQQTRHPNTSKFTSKYSDFSIEIEEKPEQDLLLPPESPFANWKEARRFAGPLPFTFTYLPASKKVVIIEGVRQNWQPKPLEVKHHRISFLDSLNLHDIRLANAFYIQNIPYYWKKGKVETWQG